MSESRITEHRGLTSAIIAAGDQFTATWSPEARARAWRVRGMFRRITNRLYSFRLQYPARRMARWLRWRAWVRRDEVCNEQNTRMLANNAPFSFCLRMDGHSGSHITSIGGGLFAWKGEQSALIGAIIKASQFQQPLLVVPPKWLTSAPPFEYGARAGHIYTPRWPHRD